MKLRFLLTFLAVATGFLGTALMPKEFDLRPARVQIELPVFVDPWVGVKEDITVQELNVLAPDTDFSRRIYTTGSNSPPLMASIILSGHDLNNSIHRPERCMQAQGWTIISDEKIGIDLQNEDPETLPVRSLELVRVMQTPADSERFEPGSIRKVYAMNYYFFVGADTITASHYGRTFTDMFQRVLQGSNQRWAFIMVMADYGAHVVPPGGFTPQQKAHVDQQVAAQRKAVHAQLNTFVQRLAPKILLPTGESAESRGRVVSVEETEAKSSS